MGWVCWPAGADRVACEHGFTEACPVLVSVAAVVCGASALVRCSRACIAAWLQPEDGVRAAGCGAGAVGGGRGLVAAAGFGGDVDGEAVVAGPVDVECRAFVEDVGSAVAALAVADEGGGVAVVDEGWHGVPGAPPEDVPVV